MAKKKDNSTDQIDGLSTDQVAVLSSDAVGAITAGDVAGLVTADVASLVTTQLDGLSTGELASLSTDQVAALSTCDVAALSTECVAAIDAASAADESAGPLTLDRLINVAARLNADAIDGAVIAIVLPEVQASLARPLILLKNHGINADGRKCEFFEAGREFDPVADAATVARLVRSGALLEQK